MEASGSNNSKNNNNNNDVTSGSSSQPVKTNKRSLDIEESEVGNCPAKISSNMQERHDHTEMPTARICCNEVFPTLDAFNLHFLRVHDEGYTCPTCDENCPSIELFNEHIMAYDFQCSRTNSNAHRSPIKTTLTNKFEQK